MKDHRIKLIPLLLVYFAGFATAVYFLSPSEEQPINQTNTQNIEKTSFDKQQFIKAFNLGLHKCAYISKETAIEAAQYIMQKWHDRQDRVRDPNRI
jgi:hypothetical protein